MKKIFSFSCLFVILFPLFVTGQQTYMPPACAGKSITTISPAEMRSPKMSDLRPNPPISKTSQQKLFSTLVRILDSIYLYPDFKGLDWPAIVAEYRHKIEDGLDTEDFYAAMDQFIRKLGDKHSYFQSPVNVEAEKARLSGEGSYVGVGALFQPLMGKKCVTVVSVFPNSPAEHAGIRQHDNVLKVDGFPLIQNDTLYPFTRGPECSMTELTVQSPGKEPRTIRVIRSRLTGLLPVYSRLVPTADGRRIGYIFLTNFLDPTIPAQVKKALEDFGTLDGLILDNRMNSGGAFSVVKPILSHFTNGNPGEFIGRTTRRSLEIVADPVNNSQNVPMLILTSKYTVSYGEIFSGLLRDMGRAKIVGQTTAGKVEALYAYIFADGSRVWIAQERFEHSKTHANWQGKGVKPDAEVVAEWDEFTFETDPVLAMALKMLPKK